MAVERQIDLVRVDSSNIYAVGYAPEEQILEVQFRGGGVYRYYGVPPIVHRGIMSARSKGQYLHQVIKGVYKYRKVGQRPKAR